MVGPEVTATVFIAVVGDDVALAAGGSGWETRGWGLCDGAVGRSGNECRCLRGAVSCFGAGDGVVVAVVNIVGIVDGGCAGVDGGNVAALGGALGCVSRVWVAISVVLGVVWVLKSAVVETASVVWISTLVVLTASVWVLTSFSKTAPWDSART